MSWLEAICNSEYFEKVLTSHIPAMTSNTEPEGVASSNSEGIPSGSSNPTRRYAYYAFDKTDMQAMCNSSTTPPWWVKYEFKENITNPKKLIFRVSMTYGTLKGTTLKFQLQKTSDDSWVDIYSRTITEDDYDPACGYARYYNLTEFNGATVNKKVLYDFIESYKAIRFLLGPCILYSGTSNAYNFFPSEINLYWR